LLEVVANNASRWNVAHLLLSASTVLATPAALGLIGVLGHRGAWFGFIGGTLVAIGVVFFGIFLGVEFAMSTIASVPTEQRAGLEAGMQALIDFEGPLPAVFLGISLNLGLVVMATRLFISRAVPRWTSVVIAGASLVLVGGVFSNPIGAVGAAALLVGLGAVGLRVLKPSQ
jgi:hypothetical protein